MFRLTSKEVVSARLPRESARLIEEIAREERVDKSTVVVRALEHYTKEWKLQRAIESYREGTVTLSRAAEIAEISIWEMIDIVSKRRILLQYDVDDLEEDLKALRHG
ncbi:MAG: UPF0175 family protein [Candidatus Bathyarchaeia archaeon]